MTTCEDCGEDTKRRMRDERDAARAEVEEVRKAYGVHIDSQKMRAEVLEGQLDAQCVRTGVCNAWALEVVRELQERVLTLECHIGWAHARQLLAEIETLKAEANAAETAIAQLAAQRDAAVATSAKQERGMVLMRRRLEAAERAQKGDSDA